MPTTGQNGSSLKWSVVVIARNEQACIADCLRSVVAAFQGKSYELIFVDSASTDRTVEIARTFPAKVVCIPENAPLRPSVGRHVGMGFTTGKWILFLDGDSVLYPDWLEAAAKTLEADPKLAAVAGERVQIYEQPRSDIKQFNYPYAPKEYLAADDLGGPAAYTRQSLQEVGGFNPFMNAYEEDELGARLRKAGYKLLRLTVPMTGHYLKEENETARELFRRIGRGFPSGLGQFARHSYTHQLPTPPLRTMLRRQYQFLALEILGLASIATSAITGQWWWFAGWLIAMTLIFLLFVIRARVFKKPAYYFLEWSLTSPLVFWGFLKKPQLGHEFPDVLQVQKHVT